MGVNKYHLYFQINVFKFVFQGENIAATKHHKLGSVHWHPGDPHVASAPLENNHNDGFCDDIDIENIHNDGFCDDIDD